MVGAVLYITTPFSLNLRITSWPPRSSFIHCRKSYAIAGFFADLLLRTRAGFRRRSSAASEPILKILNAAWTSVLDTVKVPLSVNVYSPRSAAHCKASTGNRGYWWYHPEYARAQGTWIYWLVFWKCLYLANLSNRNENFTLFNVRCRFIEPWQKSGCRNLSNFAEYWISQLPNDEILTGLTVGG